MNVNLSFLSSSKVFLQFFERQSPKQFSSSSENKSKKNDIDSEVEKNKSGKEEKEKNFEGRLRICGDCENSAEIVNGYVSFCKACGCNIQFKAMFEALSCPIGKW